MCLFIYVYALRSPLLRMRDDCVRYLAKVLDTDGTSYASDVYSFGVVVWEVLSREMPWAEECRRNIYVRVVIKKHRPEIPVDAPADLAKIINACWDCMPKRRPTFDDIMKLTKCE